MSKIKGIVSDYLTIPYEEIFELPESNDFQTLSGDLKSL